MTPIYLDNNVYYAPGLPTPSGIGTNGDPDFRPLGTSPLAGFAPRYAGNRWNFRPIGWADGGGSITCEQAREIDDDLGRVTPVGPGEWMAVDYPDYSGPCAGAGDALMARVAQVGWAQVMAENSGGYHQVSVHSRSTKASAPAAAGGDGSVVFDFTDTKVRVQNNSASGQWTGSLWVLLDLRDWLMDFVPGTANPASIPAPVPEPGSDAIVETQFGLWTRNDFFGAPRPVPGTVGAMEAAR